MALSGDGIVGNEVDRVAALSRKRLAAIVIHQNTKKNTEQRKTLLARALAKAAISQFQSSSNPPANENRKFEFSELLV